MAERLTPQGPRDPWQPSSGPTMKEIEGPRSPQATHQMSYGTHGSEDPGFGGCLWVGPLGPQDLACDSKSKDSWHAR